MDIFHLNPEIASAMSFGHWNCFPSQPVADPQHWVEFLFDLEIQLRVLVGVLRLRTEKRRTKTASLFSLGPWILFHCSCFGASAVGLAIGLGFVQTMYNWVSDARSRFADSGVSMIARVEEPAGNLPFAPENVYWRWVRMEQKMQDNWPSPEQSSSWRVGRTACEQGSCHC